MRNGIHEVYLEYNHTFTSQWLQGFDWSSDESRENSFSEASKVLFDFSEKCFIAFADSLLRGEYIVYLGLVEKMDMFKDVLLSSFNKEGIEYFETRELEKRSAELSDAVSFLIDVYKNFIISLQNKYRLENHHYIVNAFSIRGRKSSLPELFRVFCDILIPLSRLDHFFVVEENTARNLIFYKHSIEALFNGYVGDALDLLKGIAFKCNYLLFKTLRNDDYNPPEYLFDFERHQLNKNTGSVKLDAFVERYEFYYRENYTQNEPEIIQIRQRVLNNTLSFQDYIILAKYYKDSKNCTLNQFDNLVKAFNQKYDNALPTFGERNYDIYALRSQKNYIYNCRLSFLLDKKILDYSGAQRELNEIRLIQEQTGILNFYPYSKIIDYTILYLKELLSSESFSDDLFGKVITDLNEYILLYETAIKWCREYSYFPIMNLYKDCCIEDNVINVKLFCPSSYSRFVDYDHQKNKLEDYLQVVRLLEAERTIKKDSQNIDLLRMEMMQSKRTSLEIFGFFTGVVAIVFGGISLFSNDSLTSEILNTLLSSPELSSQYCEAIIRGKTTGFMMFALILLIFGALLFFIAMPREESFKDYLKHPKVWVMFALFVFSLIMIVTII